MRRRQLNYSTPAVWHTDAGPAMARLLLLFGYLAVMNAGARVDYTIKLGGQGGTGISGLAVAPSGDIYVVGTTRSRDFGASGYQKQAPSSNLYRVDDRAVTPIYSLVGSVLSLAPDPKDSALVWAGTSN